MNGKDPTPQLVKELQKFEEKKKAYMREADLEQETQEIIKKEKQKGWLYWFRHPNFRLLTSCLVVFLNFYIFAEDPISHSVVDARVGVIGKRSPPFSPTLN